ncbi:MAG: hypothetical protein JWM04_1453 [Verrucomicrobiales bacterium]|nr:hypothetical protein [Verrucomicrobiales bacterium]
MTLRLRGSRIQQLICFVLFAFLTSNLHAAVQFDVFQGFANIAKRRSHVPIVIELKTDGPAINGTIEITSDTGANAPTRIIHVELPTGTRKRISFPYYVGGNSERLTYRFLDGRGKLIAEQATTTFAKTLYQEVPLMAHLARNSGGAIVLPEANQKDLSPLVARLESAVFPEDPLSLEALDVLYLNSRIAADLTMPQSTALQGWVQGGGTLVLGIEQENDVTGITWLRNFCELSFKGTIQTKSNRDLVNFAERGFTAINQAPTIGTGVRNSRTPFVRDDAFEPSSLLLQRISAPGQKILASAEGNPIAIKMRRGRGSLIVLGFSPEMEPFVSWKQNNRIYFWSQLTEIPVAPLVRTDFLYDNSVSTEQSFSAFLQTSQVRKLPLTALIFLLLGYLLVIGPVDYIVLKKMKRQMLTWITFPCYVVLFSLLIYYIGFRLRAGLTEFNQLHIVDVVEPSGDRALQRGYSFYSLYSQANNRFPFAGNQKYSTWRGTFGGNVNSSGESGAGDITLTGNSFKADASVKIWTSQDFVQDWMDIANVPYELSAFNPGESIKVRNRLSSPLRNLTLVYKSMAYVLPDLPANSEKLFKWSEIKTRSLMELVAEHKGSLLEMVRYQQNTFGGNVAPHDDSGARYIAASLFSAPDRREENGILGPSSFQLSKTQMDRVILFAFVQQHKPIDTPAKFETSRGSTRTLYRLVLDPDKIPK